LRVVSLVGMGRAARRGFLTVAGSEVRHQLRLPHRRLAAEHQLREHAARERVLGLLGSRYLALAVGVQRGRCGRHSPGARFRRRLGIRGASRALDLAGAGRAFAASATTTSSPATAASSCSSRGVTTSARGNGRAGPQRGRRFEWCCAGRWNAGLSRQRNRRALEPDRRRLHAV
jgi:hypothetical protein